MTNWQTPVTPMFTDSLIREWVEEEKQKGPKPTALGTPLRFSGAADCGRALSYTALGAEITNPFDAPGVWVTGLGTHIHEWVQDAIGRRYPGALFEVPSGDEAISGSSDGLLDGHIIRAVIPDWEGGTAVFELKTMGGFAFEKAIGLKKQRRVLENPEGPRVSAVLQAAMNAYYLNADTLIIGAIALESASKGVARAIGLSDTERFIAEWHIPKATWWVWAEEEIARQTKVLEMANEGKLSGRVVVEGLTEEGLDLKAINPTAERPYWKCDYCAFQDLCVSHPDGIVSVTEVKLKENK